MMVLSKLRQRADLLIEKGLFISAHQICDLRFYSAYRKLVKNQLRPYSELRKEQDSQLRRIIDYAYSNIPYYHRVFKDLNITPEDVKGISDLEKLPILTKEIIKQNWDQFKPLNINKIKYYEWATGGSTGTPLRYRVDKFDRFLAGAILYKGWGYAGYCLGDRMIFLAGASLDVGTKSNLITKAHEIARNIRKLSSFDMGEVEMGSYVRTINSYKPKFIRGYASSIYFFSKWVKDNNLSIDKPLAVLTTAEKLYPHMRKMIEGVFDCEVYDGYGLNDGGISAFECSEHSGLHIDMERSVMEVVEKDGHQLDEGDGRILATSLHNYAMPFLRYDTDDIGHIIQENCSCGRGYRLLRELVGRSVDVLITPEGKSIHGWFFLYVFWEYCKGIKEYQVVQEKLDKIVIKIVPGNDFDGVQLHEIRETIRKRSGGWDVEFKFVDKIERTGAGKYKFIMNKMGASP